MSMNPKHGRGQSLYLSLRQSCARFPVMRATLDLAAVVRDWALDGSTHDLNELDLLYSIQRDPFGTQRECELRRLDCAEHMLGSISNDIVFHNAVEIGCGEGMFSERLAQRCENLLALDLCSWAVERTSTRCSQLAQVRVQQWDLRKDVLPGGHDLIVAIGVLEYIRRPLVLAQVREKLVAALRSGGYLLIGTTHKPQYERPWWGKWFLRGILVNEFVGAHPDLTLQRKVAGQYFLPFTHVLFRKRGATGPPDSSVGGAT